MWGLLNAVAAPVKSAAIQFGRNQVAGAVRNAGLNALRKYRQTPVGSPAEALGALNLTLNTPIFRQGAAATGGLAAIDVSNKTGFTGQIEGALNRVGPALDQLFSGTPQAVQQFGKEQEKKGWGGALEMAAPLGFLAAPFIPNTRPSSNTSGARPVGTQAVLNGKPVYWGGDDYGWQQLNQTGSSATLNSLNAPATQRQFVQDSFSGSPAGAPLARPAGTGSFTPLDPYAAQNREYERERARVEAMVKANPDMQKQAIADERAKVRDQGMAIWAQKNPELAAKLQPSAVGYNAVQQALIGKNAGQAARESFGYQTPQQITLTPPPGVNAPQSFPAIQSIEPAEVYTRQGLQLDPEMIKKFQTFLNQTKQ